MDRDTQVGIYAAVLRRLVLKDNTFGGTKSPFKHVYVLDGLVKDAGQARKEGRPPDAFPTKVKAGVRDQLRALPPIDFVDSPDSVRLGEEGLAGVKDAGVIITLGPISEDQDGVTVGSSLWCGGLCGQWMTYVLQQHEGEWRVTGTAGPSAIS